jgi:3-methyladenine DNA glycosylase AlkD
MPAPAVRFKLYWSDGPDPTRAPRRGSIQGNEDRSRERSTLTSTFDDAGYRVTITQRLGDAEFRLFESWLSRITSWADHDALVHYLIAPMIAAKPVRGKEVFRWAKSSHRWQRRAACVALIVGTRQRMFLLEIVRLSNSLLSDEDDMVQKGLGWLLRETAKADAERTVPYLMKIRKTAPRLVLRTACETLPRATRKQILAL